MTKWIVIYRNGSQEIIEIEDFYDLHGKCDSDEVMAVIRFEIRVKPE